MLADVIFWPLPIVLKFMFFMDMKIQREHCGILRMTRRIAHSEFCVPLKNTTSTLLCSGGFRFLRERFKVTSDLQWSGSFPIRNKYGCLTSDGATESAEAVHRLFAPARKSAQIISKQEHADSPKTKNTEAQTLAVTALQPCGHCQYPSVR